MYSRYTSCKKGPEEKDKERQTQVKRQGSSETSRIKPEIVETSRIKLGSVETSRIKLEIVETSRIKLEIVETSRIKLGSVETSRIKLEIVETSRIKLDTVETSRRNWELMKHLAFQTREHTQKGMTATTSGANWRKGNITEGKKTSIKIRGKQRYDEYN